MGLDGADANRQSTPEVRTSRLFGVNRSRAQRVGVPQEAHQVMLRIQLKAVRAREEGY